MNEDKGEITALFPFTCECGKAHVIKIKTVEPEVEVLSSDDPQVISIIQKVTQNDPTAEA